jgi:hypothetical protein
MAKNQMANILAKTDKDIGNTSMANGVLSRLFRKMLMTMNVNENRWNLLMHAFLNDARNGIPQTRKDQTSMRGNLTKEFARPQMTWKVFCKAMMFMQFTRFEVCIIARTASGKEVAFSTEVNLGDRSSGNLQSLAEPEKGDKDE